MRYAWPGPSVVCLLSVHEGVRHNRDQFLRGVRGVDRAMLTGFPWQGSLTARRLQAPNAVKLPHTPAANPKIRNTGTNGNGGGSANETASSSVSGKALAETTGPVAPKRWRKRSWSPERGRTEPKVPKTHEPKKNKLTPAGTAKAEMLTAKGVPSPPTGLTAASTLFSG